MQLVDRRHRIDLLLVVLVDLDIHIQVLAAAARAVVGAIEGASDVVVEREVLVAHLFVVIERVATVIDHLARWRVRGPGALGGAGAPAGELLRRRPPWAGAGARRKGMARLASAIPSFASLSPGFMRKTRRQASAVSRASLSLSRRDQRHTPSQLGARVRIATPQDLVLVELNQPSVVAELGVQRLELTQDALVAGRELDADA